MVPLTQTPQPGQRDPPTPSSWERHVWGSGGGTARPEWGRAPAVGPSSRRAWLSGCPGHATVSHTGGLRTERIHPRRGAPGQGAHWLEQGGGKDLLSPGECVCVSPDPWGSHRGEGQGLLALLALASSAQAWWRTSPFSTPSPRPTSSSCCSTPDPTPPHPTPAAEEHAHV